LFVIFIGPFPDVNTPTASLGFIFNSPFTVTELPLENNPTPLSPTFILEFIPVVTFLP
jgi:hypothetical protein